MAKSPIDLIELLKLARDRRKSCVSTEYWTKTKNLLSHAYVDYKDIYVEYCKDKGEEYNDKVFYIFQHVLVFLMMSDGRVGYREYESYKVFCEFAKVEPLTKKDIAALYDRLTVDDLVQELSLLGDLREYIEADNFEAMVQGFCYFAIDDKKKLNKNQYYILRGFFASYYDTCPDSWFAFKLKSMFSL